MAEWAPKWPRYSAYGRPTAFPTGDTDCDGDWDASDATDIGSNYTPGSTYAVLRDGDLDGDVDASDVTHANSITGGYQTLGRDVLTSAGVKNRTAYAGYQYDPTFAGLDRHLHHVRFRVYDAELGRWTRRDPLGYVDGMGLYEYVQSAPMSAVDGSGLQACSTASCSASATVFLCLAQPEQQITVPVPPLPTLPPFGLPPSQWPAPGSRYAICTNYGAWVAATFGLTADTPCWNAVISAFIGCCVNQGHTFNQMPNLTPCLKAARAAYVKCARKTPPWDMRPPPRRVTPPPPGEAWPPPPTVPGHEHPDKWPSPNAEARLNCIVAAGREYDRDVRDCDRDLRYALDACDREQEDNSYAGPLTYRHCVKVAYDQNRACENIALIDYLDHLAGCDSFK